jgi:hypothetical protein
MSTHAAQLLEQQLFSALKTQIISLATPLYGTRAEDASKVYDVVSYCMPNDIDNADNNDSNTKPRRCDNPLHRPVNLALHILDTHQPCGEST